MCPCDKETNRVCEHDAQRIRDLYASREQARTERRVRDAHTYTLLLLAFASWQVLAVTGEYASNAPAMRGQQRIAEVDA